MKHKFTTFDIKALVAELQHLIGLRVVNVYDADSKTFLIKLNKPDVKCMLLLESGIRLHTTEFEWPKNVFPSSFAMKMRKHLKGRRLEKLTQLGCDRIIDMQFGSSEAAYHIILEMYDRGNIVLTDYEYTILNIQRPRTDNSTDVKFIVREKYPIENAKSTTTLQTIEDLSEILKAAQDGDNLKKILNPFLAVGGHLIEHCLLEVGLSSNAKIGKDFDVNLVAGKIFQSIKDADNILTNLSNTKGYIIQEKEKKIVKTEGQEEYLLIYSEFHPMLFRQYRDKSYLEFESFDKAVDEFFSKIESQKQDRKLLQQETMAIKKLDHIKCEHLKRIEGLQEEQAIDIRKATLIELNLEMVDEAISTVRSAIASQIDWKEIENLLMEASKDKTNTTALSIKSLDLATNHIQMLLKVPDEALNDFDLKPMKISIDLMLSAYSNACKYFNLKRQAEVKQNKTINVSEKAFKSAEKKTMQALKEVQAVATIIKARKTHWFEKFLWFVSSENYVVIGGRDQQQNEIIVKKYLKAGDIYVHADLHGASSVVIKNPKKDPVPPVTLNEAGSMALCYSAAWEAKVVTQSWWVYHDQVSKTAPSGEYLTTGSFMIRGKKNYLPPSYLIYGFGFLFKLDESSLERHRNERRVRATEEDVDYLTVLNLTEDNVDLVFDEEEEILIDEDKKEQVVNDKEYKKLEGCENVLNKIDKINEIDDILVSEKIDCKENFLNEIKTVENTDSKIEIVKTHLNHTEPVVLDNNSNEQLIEKNLHNNNNNIEPLYCNEKLEFPETNIQFLNINADNNFGSDHKTCGKLSIKDRKNIKKLQKKNLHDSNLKGENFSVDHDNLVITPDNDNTVNDSNILYETNSDQLNFDDMKDKQNTVKSSIKQSCVKPQLISQKYGTVNSNATEKSNTFGENQQQLKRGQRSKLKKIKEKYGDQDEEEREMRMQLLASNQQPKNKDKKMKNTKVSKINAGKSKPIQAGRKQLSDIIVKNGVENEVIIREDAGEEFVEEKDDETDHNLNLQDVDILDSLTGIPYPDDILLYCIPVCAPYSVMSNYKFKVKLAPGTTKRGKAAKMVLNMFMHERSTTSLEKDLLRSVKDTDLSRNIPGAVKVSTTRALASKQKLK